eukprot:3984961-Prymnesium_polylepis.1
MAVPNRGPIRVTTVVGGTWGGWARGGVGSAATVAAPSASVSASAAPRSLASPSASASTVYHRDYV